MKNKLLLLTTWFCAANIQAQNWLPLDKGIECLSGADVKKIVVDSTRDKLYTNGIFAEDGNCVGMRGMAVWNGNRWDSIGNGTQGSTMKYMMTVYNDTIYAHGNFYDANANFYLAKWNDTSWDTIKKSPDAVMCSIQKNGILYLGGGFNYLGNDSTYLLGSYDGLTFHGLTPTYPSASGWTLLSMAFFQDTLFVGGKFDMLPYKNISNFAKWDGSDIQPVHSEFSNNGALSIIETMVVFQGALYLGGYFRKSDGYTGDNIMKWDGHNFTEVGNGVNERVTTMKVYNNELYVGGSFTEVDGSIMSNYVAKWDGSNWYSLTTDSFIGSYPMVRDINFYRDSLIISGTFTSINGDTAMHGVAKYVQALSSVQTFSSNFGVEIFPNPVKHLLSIDFLSNLTENTTLEIKNTLGQTMQQLQLAPETQKTEIDVSRLPSGLYFLEIKTKSTMLSKKFSKIN